MGGARRVRRLLCAPPRGNPGAVRAVRAGFHEENSLLIRFRSALFAVLCLLPAISSLLPREADAQPAQRPQAAPTARTQARPASAQPRTPVAPGGEIRAIRVQGNERIEQGTILSYLLIQPGDRYDQDRIDRSLKTLYSTGLFQDVTIRRDGPDVVVQVVENPLVNRIAFEGNKKLTDEQLRPEIGLKSRAVFTPAQAQADRQRILDMYAKRARFDARVEPKIIRLDQNRVDVVFEINEGEPTLVSRIAFVGNKAFSEGTLGEVVNSREQAWWRVLSSSDQYDPERVNFDKELLRRFYLKNGYIDFEVTDAKAELSPDRKSFFLTYTLREGERYRYGKISVTSQLRRVTGDELRPTVSLSEGDWYNGDAVSRTVDQLVEEVQSRGIVFVDVKPRVTRDAEKHTVDLAFEVTEGPRVYVERIDIQGNVRTEDKVIRREMRLAEGDALNPQLIRKSRTRLTDLQYFGGVDLQPQPGSSPDKTVVNVNVQEKATGELSFGGGYSTDAGALVDIGLRERNLLGTGISAGINGVLAQKRSSIDAYVTDPYFLDRNLVAGADIFYITTNHISSTVYDEKRVGFTLNAGYQFNEHLSQGWSYSLIQRDVTNIEQGASFYITDQAGYSSLSQIGQILTLDYRDSRINPHEGFVTRLGTDFAGIGGDSQFIRTKLDGSLYVPLERYFRDPEWVLSISGGIGYFFNLGTQEKIIDRFFLGGENLRGFEAGGAGPHDIQTGDALGGRFIWTQSTELRFPLPVPADLGITGRTFVDVGSNSQASFESGVCPNAFPGTANPNACPPIFQSALPRVGAGVGISWQTPLGLINIDLTPFVIKQKFDQTQVFRFGFGTRF
jgi:outer membrane protein insertion porin family